MHKLFRSKTSSTVAAVLAVILLLGSGFALGYQSGRSKPKHVTVEGVANVENKTTADFDVFWETWDLIDRRYLGAEDVTPEDKVYGAVSGLVNSLGDPHSDFFTTKQNKQFRENIQGSFGGVGMEIGIREDQLTVVSPLKNTPAMEAGLKAGDKILQVNATSTANMGINEAVQIIRGPIGSKVALTVYREAWEEPREIRIVRDKIEIPTIEFTMREGNIAHIELMSFNGNANRQFYNTALKALLEGAGGMVLDLRNNPGGYLEVAVNLAGWFVPRGEIVVSEESRVGEGKEFRSNGSGVFKDLPLVILVNEGSASASEILAGALRAYNDTPLVGAKTFGKGSIQNVEQLSNGSSVKLTVGKWVLPDGSVLEGDGLEPDYSIEITEEDVDAERDPQLEKAIEVLREQMEPGQYQL